MAEERSKGQLGALAKLKKRTEQLKQQSMTAAEKAQELKNIKADLLSVVKNNPTNNKPQKKSTEKNNKKQSTENLKHEKAGLTTQTVSVNKSSIDKIEEKFQDLDQNITDDKVDELITLMSAWTNDLENISDMKDMLHDLEKDAGNFRKTPAPTKSITPVQITPSEGSIQEVHNLQPGFLQAHKWQILAIGGPTLFFFAVAVTGGAILTDLKIIPPIEWLVENAGEGLAITANAAIGGIGGGGFGFGAGAFSFWAAKKAIASTPEQKPLLSEEQLATNYSNNP